LAIPAAALFSLVVFFASADVIGILPSAAFDLLFSPLYFVAIYALSFVVSPFIESRLPINAPMHSGITTSTRNSVGFRTVLIVMFGLVLVLAANLLVFLIS
jgi:hypothetical protein